MVLIALSTLDMMLLFQSGAETSRVYYDLDTRAAELLTGALLAGIIHRPVSKNPSQDTVPLPTSKGDGDSPFHCHPWAETLAGTLLLIGLVIAFFTVRGEVDSHATTVFTSFRACNKNCRRHTMSRSVDHGYYRRHCYVGTDPGPAAFWNNVAQTRAGANVVNRKSTGARSLYRTNPT